MNFIHSPRLCLRCTDDTFATIQSAQKELFHVLSKQCISINFTVESEVTGRIITFLDCRLKPITHETSTSAFTENPHIRVIVRTSVQLIPNA